MTYLLPDIDEDDGDDCLTCGGTGEIYDSGEDSPCSDNDEDYHVCPDCFGTGTIERKQS